MVIYKITNIINNKVYIGQTSGGDSFNHSVETKEKIRKSKLGFKFSKESRDKMSKSAKGRKMTEAQKKKISEALKGRHAHNKGKRRSNA